MAGFEERQPSVLYEVYEKRALYEGIDDLPLLDRGPLALMKESANNWGGLVVRVTCNIITERPMQRQVIRWQVVYMHRSKATGQQPHGLDTMTVKTLHGRLQQGNTIARPNWNKRARN